MNKQEFIDQLSKELRARNIAGADEILSDFNAHFDEAMRAGQPEEDVCRVLGDPREIADQCVQDFDEPSAEPPTPMGDNQIHVDLLSVNLALTPITGSDFDVHIESNSLMSSDPQLEDDFIIEKTGASLRVTQVKARTIAAQIMKMMSNRTVVIGVPAQFCGSIDVRMRSGNAKFEGPIHATDFSCDQTSGNVQVTNLSCESCSVRSNSGEVRLDRISSGLCDLQLRSGNVKTQSCSAEMVVVCSSGTVSILDHHGNVSVDSKSGNVVVETDVLDKDSAMNMRSGNLKVRVSRLAANLDLSCTSGNVTVTIGELHGNVTATTMSGNVTAYLSPTVQADFRLSSLSSRNDFAMYVPGPNLPVVALTSRSGIVQVKKS